MIYTLVCIHCAYPLLFYMIVLCSIVLRLPGWGVYAVLHLVYLNV